jgi:hypothetical protein
MAGTASVASVASSATVVTLKEANGNREGLMIFNDSTQILYVKYGTGATSSDFSYKLTAGQYHEMQAGCLYSGKITGIWASANGAALVTELTG